MRLYWGNFAFFYYFFFISIVRLVVNTLSCVLVYHFERVAWDYTCPRDKTKNCKSSVTDDVIEKPIHSQSRALKVQCVGSPVHKQTSPITNLLPLAEDYYITEMSQNLSMRSASSFGNHIMRIQSKTPTSLFENEGILSSERLMSMSELNHKENNSNPIYGIAWKHKDNHMNEIVKPHVSMSEHKWTAENNNTGSKKSMKSHMSDVFNMNNHKGNISEQKQQRHRVEMKSRARCRSAPVNRIRALPKNRRGVTTSAETTASILKNKIVLPPKRSAPLSPRKISTPVEPSQTEIYAQAVVPLSRKISAHVSKSSLSASTKKTNNSSTMDGLTDLKIKTFHFQLEFENDLKKQKSLKR